jgi:hypothetical protein
MNSLFDFDGLAWVGQTRLSGKRGFGSDGTARLSRTSDEGLQRDKKGTLLS